MSNKQKIKVRRWSGFLAQFSHPGGIARNFSETSDDAVQSLRRRSFPGVDLAEVDDTETKAPTLLNAADHALRFLSGLNLQDHDMKEQKEYTEVVHALLKALKPQRYGT